MSTAKALTPTEIEKVLNHIEQNSNAKRNRLMFMMTAMAGLRVSEVAYLTINDVRNTDGTIRSEVFLDAERVKNKHARTVYINSRLKAEIEEYVANNKWIVENQEAVKKSV